MSVRSSGVKALEDAREIGHVATLMIALFHAWLTHVRCGSYTAATAEADEQRDARAAERLCILLRRNYSVHGHGQIPS